MAMVNNKLYIASENDFMMVDITPYITIADGEVKRINIEKDDGKILKISIPKPLKMHGFFSNSFSEE